MVDELKCGIALRLMGSDEMIAAAAPPARRHKDEAGT